MSRSAPLVSGLFLGLFLGLWTPGVAVAAIQTGGEPAAKPAAKDQRLQIQWRAPTSFVAGSPFRVNVELTAPPGGSVVSGWLLTPAAFSLDGKSLGEREEKGSMALPEGAKVTAEIVRHGRTRSITVFKKKRRKNYRRTRGHRQGFTKLLITGIATA